MDGLEQRGSDALPKRREPRTSRGRLTRQRILDAAAVEFGNKGFYETSIVAITSRAGVALGSFYTYFASKQELFEALVRHLSDGVRDAVVPAIEGISDPIGREGKALAAFLGFAREHREIYRIIDEAEFVAPDAWRHHYTSTAKRIEERLTQPSNGFDPDTGEIEAWAIMGMNVFLGLRSVLLDRDASDPAEIAARVARLLQRGLPGNGSTP